MNIRLSAAERWVEVTNPALADAGAMYFTFILPSEFLQTRRFPIHGSLAFIFREPEAESDARDCFFAILQDY